MLPCWSELLQAVCNGKSTGAVLTAALFCVVAGAYNKVALSLLQQAGVAQSESERLDLVVEAYEKCVGAVPWSVA